MAGASKKQKPKNRKPRQQSLFINAGLLSDSPTPSKGKKNGLRNKSKGLRFVEKRQMNAVGYIYPPQIDPLPDESGNEHDKLEESDPIGLVDNKIVACIDQTEVKESENVKYTDEYDANSEVDDTPHRGLGFHDSQEDPFVTENTEGLISDSSSSEEIETDTLSSPEKSSGFLSIGGMKVYTHDVSEAEDDDDKESEEESSDSEGSSNSSDSDTSSDIDDEIAKDYIEGIGGSYKDSNLDVSYVDVDINDTIVKFGGIALQEASREYGMKKPWPRKKSQSQTKSVKDPRIAYAQKKKSAKSNHSNSRRLLPGEKQKQRQDTIALKRRDRMLHRGVDLEEINSKLEQMVQNEGDIMSFQLMHSWDCSQVQRLASIYRLSSSSRSKEKGSGKRRFVTVTRTEHTGMPSSVDRIRLEKFIRGPVIMVNNNTPSGEIKGTTGLSPLDSRLTKSKTSGGSSNNKRREKDKPVAYSTQPVSFISCGIMEPEAGATTLAIDESKPRDPTASSSSYGSFERHTTGFGSRMLAKMGYVDGNGLGKEGKGIAEPIEVVQRPKSLGLGAMAPEETTPPQLYMGQSSSSSERRDRLGNAHVGSFEKHTKGFGSKMMAKMGYVDGTGLGRESQGIVNPLGATRLPKSRGLGADG